MKNIFKIIVSLIIIVCIATGATIFFKNYDSPKSTIEKFEQSYNNADIDGMIECFDPSIQALYSGANSIMSDLVGIDISDISNMLPFLSEVDDSFSYEELPKIDIKVVDVVKTSDSTATVLCEFSYYGSVEEDNIEMVKIDGEWYISGEEFYNQF